MADGVADRKDGSLAFDIEDYKARTGRLEWEDLDLAAAFAATPLDADSLRCVRYMHDVEYHTVCYLREVLLTPAHEDPEVTAFLSLWAFEEFWHGEALGAVLRAHGESAGTDRVAPMRTTKESRDRLGLLITAVAGQLLGSDFTAIHMTWGAINEWTTQAGYAQLSRRAEHPVLTELLNRIMRQEGRHIDFYASQAKDRLAASPRAQRFTRLALSTRWNTVGSGVMPGAETDFIGIFLFGDDEGRAMAQRIDRRTDRLAGLDGLRLLETTLDRALGIAPPRKGVLAAAGARATRPFRAPLARIRAA